MFACWLLAYLEVIKLSFVLCNILRLFQSLRKVSKMKKKLLTFLVVLFLAGCGYLDKGRGNLSNDTKTSKQINEIDSLIQQLVLDKHTVGVSFGIQVDNSKSFTGSYGIADIEYNSKVNDSTLFNIASITKPFTALGIVILVQENKLSFEDTIDQFFPDFPNGHKITIYQLLSHTSGIPESWIGGLPKDISSDWVIKPKPHLILQKMKNLALFEPGTKYSYSSSGYLLLGEIIEQLTGQSYQDFIKKKILRKYGATLAFIEEKEMRRTNLWSNGYGVTVTDSIKNEKSFFKHDFAAYNLKSFGGLKSNPSDLLELSKALFDARIANENILNQMLSYARTNNGNYVYDELYFPSGFQPPPLPEHLEKNGYGLGFSLMTIYGVPVIWHSGGMPGYNAVWAHFPNNNTTLVMFSNTDNGLIPEYENIMKICSQIGD